MFQHLRNGLRRRIRHAGFVQDGRPLLRRARCDEFFDPAIEHVLVLHPVGIGAKACVVDPLGMAQHARKGTKQLVVTGGDDDETIL